MTLKKMLLYLLDNPDKIDRMAANLLSITMLAWLVGGLSAMLVYLHMKESNTFDLTDAFRGKDGRAEKTAIAFWFGVFGGLWLIVTMEAANHTNEIIVSAWLLYLVGAYAVHKGVGQKSSVADPPTEEK